ncbi:MAG TPA: hypothetical protein VHZ55_20335, partial [Bryobacteraceae bacterium]|nr:hypothetical protein [Bryobacteraceae bacterium]
FSRTESSNGPACSGTRPNRGRASFARWSLGIPQQILESDAAIQLVQQIRVSNPQYLSTSNPFSIFEAHRKVG